MVKKEMKKAEQETQKDEPSFTSQIPFEAHKVYEQKSIILKEI